MQFFQHCLSWRSKTANIKFYNYKHETHALVYRYKTGSWQIYMC